VPHAAAWCAPTSPKIYASFLQKRKFLIYLYFFEKKNQKTFARGEARGQPQLHRQGEVLA
jgi:hypothetical protein